MSQHRYEQLLVERRQLNHAWDDLIADHYSILEEGELFAKRHISVAAKITPKSFRRVESPQLPYDVIREALTNALCHRDYSMKNGSAGLAFYSNRIEILNSGGLQSGITIEQIKRGLSKPRNKRIAFVLHKCGYIEHWGRGIEEMIHGCVEAKLPEPVFENIPLEFKVIFPLSEKALEIKESKPIELPKDLNKRQLDIIRVLTSQKGNSLKLKELETLLENRYPERTLRRELNNLKDMGLVDRTGQTNKLVWFIKE